MPPRPQPGMQPTATTTAVYRKPVRWHSAPRPHKTMRHLSRVAPSKIQCTNPNASQAAARHATHGHHNCRVTSPLTALPASQNNETPTTCSAVQHAPNNQVQRRQACEMIRDVDEVFKVYTVHQLCLTGRSQADNSRHGKLTHGKAAAPPGQGPVTTCATPCTFQASALEAGKGRQEPSPTRQKREIPCTQAVARHNERPQTIMALISRVPAPMLGTTNNFRPNARDPPRTRLNTTTSQFSLPSTGDPCIIHKKWTRRVRMQTQ